MAADRPREADDDQLWSVDYFRFWVARRLITLAPAFLFVGEPLFNLFLRCLGAKIGARAVIATAAVPVAADLFEVGEDAVHRPSRHGAGLWRGRAEPALRRDPRRQRRLVGEAQRTRHGVEIGDFAQLGHASSLQSGQRVPDGKRYHGSPAEETVDQLPPRRRTDDRLLRRVLFTPRPPRSGARVIAARSPTPP